MKCKDCYARNGKDVCLIGQKSRMLVCGHYGCDLQQRTVEKRMGITNPMTNGDIIRQMSDEELAEFMAEQSTAPSCVGQCHKDYDIYGKLQTFCSDCWLDWLRKEANDGQ